jgi:hypothetical protein
LWRYYVERSAVVSDFKQIAEREGLRRVSFRNLAEFLLRMWVPLRPVKRPLAENTGTGFVSET